MNILGNNSDIVKEILKKSIVEPNLELEYVYGNTSSKLSKYDFSEVIKYCKDNLKKLNTHTSLDIKAGNLQYKNVTYENIRTTIDGLTSIKKYCKTDSLKDINTTYLLKSVYKNKDRKYDISSNDYNYRVNLKNETILDEDDPKVIDMENDWGNIKKYFRFKQRISFITNDGLFRIDLTVVKSNSYNSKLKTTNLYTSFKESGVLNEQEKYELEIEYVGNNYKVDDIYNIINFIEYIESGKEYGYKNDNIYKSVGVITSVDIDPIFEEKLSPIDTSLIDILEEKLSKQSIITKIYESLNNTIYDILQIIHNKQIITSRSESDKILESYFKLTGQNKILIGPQPVSFQFKNLSDNENSNETIMKNYLVTEKADGERYVLYINSEKEGYIINKKSLMENTYHELINTGLIFPEAQGEWILDGEYITNTKNNEPLNIYLIFDVYYANNDKVFKYPFISKNKSRSGILEEFRKIMDTKKMNPKYKDIITSNMDIGIKEYLEGGLTPDITDKKYNKSIKSIFKKKKILNQSKTIWERSKKEGYIYKIDGLIYLPSDLPVGGNYTDCIAPETITGTWNHNLKWKPEYENTIDFQVSIVTERKTERKTENKVVDKVYQYTESETNGEKVMGEYKKVILKVIYDENKDNSIQFCMDTLNGKFPKIKKRNSVNIIPFTPEADDNFGTDIDYGQTNIKLDNGKILCEWEKSGEEVKTGDIVEMVYVKDNENDMIWLPLRIRKDKTKPQADWVAKNIWETIKYPITEEMIIGEKNIPEQLILETEDDYYVADNKESQSEPLRKLHNYIKSKLIGGVGSSSDLPDKKRILDTSIGRGGDIKKYMRSDINVKFLLGMDIAPIDEACKRYYFARNPEFLAAFIRYDTSKSIENNEGVIGDSTVYPQQMLNILYDRKEEIYPEYINVDKRYNNKASNGFNIISSQFSIHYYFKDEETLNGYLQNISDNCNKNSIFIGNCYDGSKIFNKFKELEQEGKNIFEYKVKDCKSPIYSIKKEYVIDDFTFNPDKPEENMLGQKINVFMDSIGKNIDEYLVNFEYFINKMKEYGFEPYKPKMKPKYNSVFDGAIGSFKEIIDKLPELSKHDSELKNVKIYKKATEISKNKELEELSSMNNYFMFKKIN